MFDWIGLISDVVNIGMKLLPLIFLDSKGRPRVSDPYYKLGPVAFTHEKGKVWVQNTGEQGDLGLTYSRTTPDFALTVHQPLAANNWYDATADMKDFDDGRIAVSPTATDVAVAGGMGRALSFAIRMLAIGVAFRILGNASVGVYKEENGYCLKFKNDKPMKGWKVDATVSDTKGQTTQVSSEFKSHDANGNEFEEIVHLGDGVDFDPIVGSLSLYIVMDAKSYASGTAERSQLECSPATHGEPPLLRLMRKRY